jgi:hypothetical protein
MSMTQSPLLDAKVPRKSPESSPEHRWIHRGTTPNPAPGARTKDDRDTAQGCRDRATADLLQAITMNTANGRQVLEKSAASWAVRAELLQRIEVGIEARRAPVKLTALEVAEDAEHGRMSPGHAATVQEG